MARTCCSSFGQYHGQTTTFCYENTQTCAACWTALWHLVVLCQVLCHEGYRTVNG